MSTRRFRLFAVLYGLFIVYGSTVIGPAGLNFVPFDPLRMVARFIVQATTWVDHGSDQRSDWMGNLLMLVPFGFLLTGAVRPDGQNPRRPERRISGLIQPLAVTAAALGIGLTFILAMKYVQLFFPPRTVTLNYIVAQMSGCCIGVALFWTCRRRLAEIAPGLSGGALENPRTFLQIYTAALMLFILMPLDFAISLDDFRDRLDHLPEIVMRVPGAGRSAPVRIAFAVAGVAAMVPVGMLLTISRRRRTLLSAPGRAWLGRSTLSATGAGFLMMSGMLFLSAFLLSGAPSLLALAERISGIAIGAALMHWVSRQDPDALRRQLAASVPWMVAPYLLLVLGVNGLISVHWRTLSEACDALYLLGLLPLFDWYIVSKAAAAKNIAAHVAIYAPIGVMAWLRARRTGSAGTAFRLAFALALAVELGRYMRPGLQGDINAVAVGAVAAWLAATAMPTIWLLVSAVARPAVPCGITGWRERAAAARAHADPRVYAATGSRAPLEPGPRMPVRSGIDATGEIEHF